MPTGIYKHQPQQGFQKGHKIRLGKVGYWKGKNFSVFHKQKLVIARKRRYSITLGKHWKMSEQAKENHREAVRRRIEAGLTNNLYGKLENHFNWQGGKSFEPYGLEFNNELREEIRKRDNYTCQKCDRKEKEMNGFHKRLTIHHIDYDKENCLPDNLITLCQSCNSKVNFNRDYWMNYFKGLTSVLI